MSDQEKYKKKYLALKKQMEGGQKQIGGETYVTKASVDYVYTQALKPEYEDLLICPIVLMQDNTLTPDLNIKSTWSSDAAVMFTIPKATVEKCAIAYTSDLNKEFMFHTSIVNGIIYRKIIKTMKETWADEEVDTVLKQFFTNYIKNSDERDNIKNIMIEIIKAILAEDEILFKFIINSYNVVNLLSSIDITINNEKIPLVSKLHEENYYIAYNLVLKLFSINPFDLYNFGDFNLGSAREYKRHANHLLYYFYRDEFSPYKYTSTAKPHKTFKFELIHSTYGKAKTDMSFLIVHSKSNEEVGKGNHGIRFNDESVADGSDVDNRV